MNATFAPQLAVVLSFHGVVERIEHPEIQVNHVDVASFERIVELVRSRYEVVSLDDVASAVRGEASLPVNAAALTFDDAYRSVLALADPLLSGLPYAVFVPSGLVDSGSRVPTYVMRAALAFTEESRVQLPGRRRPFKLRTVDEREHAAGQAAELLRSLPRAEVEDVLLRLRELLPAERWAEVDAAFASEALLGWDELRSLAARGVTVGSHTRDHAVLHERQDGAEVSVQVRDSKAAIEDRLGAPVPSLLLPAWPSDRCLPGCSRSRSRRGLQFRLHQRRRPSSGGYGSAAVAADRHRRIPARRGTGGARAAQSQQVVPRGGGGAWTWLTNWRSGRRSLPTCRLWESSTRRSRVGRDRNQSPATASSTLRGETRCR